MSLRAGIQTLRASMDNLAARVQLDDAAEAFIAGNHEIREGDYFLLGGCTPTKLYNVSTEGKWTYFDGHNRIEPFATPRDVERLYTIAEVAEIVAKVRRER